MALIVEDGTGLSNAESYASVQNFKDYLNNRGVDISAMTPDARIEQCLRLATDYMVQQYRASWKGTRISPTQALDWPRYDVVLTDLPGGYGTFPYIVFPNIVPKEVINACALLAYKAFNAEDNELAPDIDRVASSEKIDVIEVTYDTSYAPVTSYRVIGAMLAPYLQGGSNGANATLLRV